MSRLKVRDENNEFRGVAWEEELETKADLVNGKVPTDQLPEMDYIPNSEKGEANGVAELDSTGKVPSEQLPTMDVEVITYSETQPTGNWNIWEKKTQEDMDAYTYSDIGIVYEGPLTEIPASYKYNVRDLTSVILKEATSIGEDAFYAAYDLTYFSAPKCEVLEENALRDCYRMTNAVLGNVKTVGEKALSDIGCTSLNLPQCETIGDMAFQASYDLREVVLGNCHSIGIAAFGNCRSFRYLTIGYDGVCELGESAIPSEISQIRVPANQVDAYKSSSQWSSYASKIVAIS